MWHRPRPPTPFVGRTNKLTRITLLKHFVVFAALACLAAALVYGVFGELPSFLRKTTSVYLKPDMAPGVEVGSDVYRSRIHIGYVHDIELTEHGDVTVELRIFAGRRLYQSDICVIHRLHRYDKATLHIEPSGDPHASREPLGDPPVLRCMIANGPWPELPGLLEQTEN